MNYTHPKTTVIAAQLAACVALIGFIASAKADTQTAQHFTDPAQDAAKVVELVERRLSLMPEVAAWKWRAGQAITDKERERIVLDRSVADAKAIGIDAEAARRFFDVQIRMARAVQAACFEQWRAVKDPQIPVARNLATQIRPQLDVIGRELLVAIYLGGNEMAHAGSNERIAGLKKYGGIDDALISELRGSVIALHKSALPSLSLIRRAGILRVGVTGDYPPFSYDANGALTGLDVQLAQALAQHLGVQVEFIRTTWPTLMTDFTRDRFDIAMGGISVTPERAAQADFSTAYHIDGKTAIARCNDALRFNSLEKIDRPEVRVIVNPGGTNERFTRQHIKRASIVVHDDNRTVFDELVSGHADAMITDGIEVELQTLRHKELCATMKTPLTRSQKAIMLPRGSDMTAEVNAWLAPQLKDGRLQAQLQRALRDVR